MPHLKFNILWDEGSAEKNEQMIEVKKTDRRYFLNHGRLYKHSNITHNLLAAQQHEKGSPGDRLALFLFFNARSHQLLAGRTINVLLCLTDYKESHDQLTPLHPLLHLSAMH